MNIAIVILMVSGFVALAMSALFFVMAANCPKNMKGLKAWASAPLIFALAVPLFIARGHIPDVFSIVLANLMLMVSIVVMNWGTKRFFGVERPFNIGVLVLLMAGFVMLFAYFTYIQPSLPARTSTMIIVSLLVFFDLARFVYKVVPNSTGRNILMIAVTLLMLTRLMRLGGILLGYDQLYDLFDVSITQLIFLGIPAISIPVLTIGCFMMTSEKLIQNLEFINRHDDLTGCLNKKAFIEELEREITYAKRYKNKLSIMMLDLDDFKEINDRFGHLVGDETLIDFTRKVHFSLRETDFFARFGGDEFVAILPNTDRQQAELVAARIHEAGRESQPVTWYVSIGITEWQGEEDSLDRMLARADKLLYQSKAQGGSQFCAF